MTYQAIKTILQRGAYDAEDLHEKLDIFLLAGRITEAQYHELRGMMGQE